MIRDAIRKVVGGESLTLEESREAMLEITGGKATAAQIAALLTALRMKGETVDEISGFAGVMVEKAARIRPKSEVVLDTCGTGGDRCGTFNISTVAAFVAAGAGVAVAKHGNRAVSSKCGSADLLEALGVRIDLAPAEVEACINEIGIGFLFAPVFHEAMQAAVGPRREIGIRTVFNILGPLANPAGATHQLVGVYDEHLTETMARVLMKRGLKRALVVHGGGLDEITICGKTRVSELDGGEIRTYEIAPEDFGIARASLDDIRGGTAEENAAIAMGILRGERGARRDVVVLNGGAALHVAGAAASIGEGVRLAERSIDEGRAMAKLEGLIRETNRGER